MIKQKKILIIYYQVRKIKQMGIINSFKVIYKYRKMNYYKSLKIKIITKLVKLVYKY